MRQDPAAAMQALRRAIALGPADFAMPYCWLGRLQYEAGDLEAASASLSKALAMDDSLVMAWAHLALISLLEGNATDAVNMAHRATGLAPRSHFSRYVLGRALLATRQYSQARQHLSVALELGGAQSLDALYLLGRSAELAGDHSEAAAAWQTLLRERPDHSRAAEGLRRIQH